MNYYDGNTVTGLWNYAQNFAMSDNSFGTTFGPSAPGAINLVSGDTGNVGLHDQRRRHRRRHRPRRQGRLLADLGRPALLRRLLDPRRGLADRPEHRRRAQRAGLSWGWFQGGFRPTTTFAQRWPPPARASRRARSRRTSSRASSRATGPRASDQGLCNAVHPVGAAIGGIGGTTPADATTGTRTTTSRTTSRSSTTRRPPTRTTWRRRRWRRSAPTRRRTWRACRSSTPPTTSTTSATSTRCVGAITHGYLSPDHLPAVSFLKAPGYQDGHAAYSDPSTSSSSSPTRSTPWSTPPTGPARPWSSPTTTPTATTTTSTAASTTRRTRLESPHRPARRTSSPARGLCGTRVPPLAGQNGRCGYGPRLPLLVISPWAKQNAVDHTLTDFSSIDQVRRGQLGPTPDPRLVRLDRRIAQLDVRLPRPAGTRSCSSTR